MTDPYTQVEGKKGRLYMSIISSILTCKGVRLIVREINRLSQKLIALLSKFSSFSHLESPSVSLPRKQPYTLTPRPLHTENACKGDFSEILTLSRLITIIAGTPKTFHPLQGGR